MDSITVDPSLATWLVHKRLFAPYCAKSANMTALVGFVNRDGYAKIRQSTSDGFAKWQRTRGMCKIDTLISPYIWQATHGSCGVDAPAPVIISIVIF